MAVTGTGTQADPYIPTTCDELYKCIVSESTGDYPGEYIELQQDFDFTQDINYREALPSTIIISTNKYIYSDTSTPNTIYRINGLRVNGASSGSISATAFLTTINSSNLTIENVFLSNAIYANNLASYANGFITTSSSSGEININNCKISLLYKTNVQHGTYFATVTGGGPLNIRNSSIYVTYAMQANYALGNIYAGSVLNASIFSGNCFEIHNLHTIGYNTFSNNAHMLYITNSTLFGDIYLNPYVSSTAWMVLSSDNIVHALQISIEGTGATTPYIVISGSGVSICDKDILDPLINKGGSANYLSTSQMKDQAYLMDIGFLP